ncbi:ApaG [Mangrovimonas yunxiaonensis]|uniref:ApaG n=1 Tax=Mangrovimonas yunxiaonensis TaxID=1197477 RepID=A0A084TI44_9FLAO|nr:DUF5103 domain-containing protein [Mangrovimonas yunxiaonensis]KFB00380.1 ApaG [Mangrovimonas yunxiaonensis]GGH35094.1 DUF5103 domain-containing protein [Mangrovimonas yunxiaonensis]
MKQLTLYLSIILFQFQAIVGQVQEVNPPDYIKTITFKGDTSESQLPILTLGEYLVLEFDALNGDEEDFYYKIEHYNYDWTPSVLARAEFMEGFDNQRIRNYENSFNTYQIYSHYKLTIPNQRTRALKVSGNYMLNIYNDYDELVFSRKFMVQENMAQVGVSIKRSRDVTYLDEKQSVDIIVNSNNIRFNNPSQTVKTLIVQNNNLTTAISGLKPQYTLGNELIYKYTKETSFWGGNEYLFFENKDIRAANNNIQFIELHDLYNNYLFTNVSRKNKPYTYNPDINGNFVITALDVEKTAIEADYAWVHFSLVANNTLKDKQVYVYGNFNNYATNQSNIMHYNADSNTYQASILLKQGFYNYKYVTVDANGVLGEGDVSGNYYQTENNYKVLVYYRDLGARYDRLIGIGETTSVNISN